MGGESVQALLSSLTTTSGESSEAVYAKWAGLVLPVGGESLEQSVRSKLTANGKMTLAGKESLLAILRAGGAVGESVQECLLKTGLTGFS